MQRSQEGARAAAWLDGMGTLWRGQAGRCARLASVKSHCVCSGGACGWRCRPLTLFPPSSLSALPSPGPLSLGGSSVTPQSPGLAASAGGPVPTHTAPSGSGTPQCPGEESVVSSQRPSGSSERTPKVFLNCFHFVLEGKAGVSLNLDTSSSQLFAASQDSPAHAVRRSPPRVPEGSEAKVSCILEFSTYRFPNPPSPPQAFSPRVPGTETSRLSSFPKFPSRASGWAFLDSLPFRTTSLLCWQLKLYSLVLCAGPVVISKPIFEISGKMLSLSCLVLVIESWPFSCLL
ncbi:uncharacterized protein LOC122422599 isoform X1 [Cervus canadensis]|uniref:uncharacterized protein LOC122422599 isoform X1 n=1 Tax=Cervus canadensis TaxID=1574408 RepID=UPI001CA31394|nr:uncharacterized protein LOC122422599 isoform X1 [Cervus canadensis]